MNQFARPGLAVTQLPSFNENDKGKALTINSESGALGWEEGSGGGGSGGGVLVVNIDMQTRTLDKTWKEISDAPFAVLRFPHPEMGGTAIAYNTITYIISGSTYKVRFNDPAYGETEFTTDSEYGYPSFSE